MSDPPIEVVTTYVTDIGSVYVATHILTAMNSVYEYAHKFGKSNIIDACVISERVLKNERKPTEIKQLYNLYDAIGKLKRVIENEEAQREKLYNRILKDAYDECKCESESENKCCSVLKAKHHELYKALVARENTARDNYNVNTKVEDHSSTAAPIPNTSEIPEEDLLLFFDKTNIIEIVQPTDVSTINELEGLF